MCVGCDPSDLTAQTRHEIERIKRNRQAMAEQKTVAVVTFARAG
jgi:hypothetical protein